MRGRSAAFLVSVILALPVDHTGRLPRLAAAPSEAPGAGSAAPSASLPGAKLRFSDVSDEAGIVFEHRLEEGAGMPDWASGGVAAGDYDGDGWIDLLLVRGALDPPVLLSNQRDGTFARAHPGGLSSITGTAVGPLFADFTGDGKLDLLVGGLSPRRVDLFASTDAGLSRLRSGLATIKNTFSAAFGDIDRDGDLDLALTHWDVNCRDGCAGDHVWRNDGGGTFEPLSEALSGFDTDHSFTPNFADIDSDGWPDLLVAADLGNSRAFLNDRAGGFVDVTDRDVITDRAGMGAAVGDYDNDGDLDWFVTSITDADGNRLYRNDGSGVFDDVTSMAGVRDGGWGWGACFADFDNDGWLDIAHVNGWKTEPDDATRLFMNAGGRRFRERARRYGLDDWGSGRGIVCFDYDRDGDIDVLVQNSEGAPRLFRNDGGNGSGWLTVRLRGPQPNVGGVGARIYARAAGETQMRELRCGNNYVSQNPVEAHFGLGQAERVSRLRVVWPDGVSQRLHNVEARQLLTVEYPSG